MRHCLLLTAFGLVIGSASAMSNAEFLSRCLNDYPGLNRTSEKGFADFVRNWVEEHDESGLPKRGSFSAEQKAYSANEAKGVLDYRFWECGTAYQFKDHKIDWTFNPTADGYREWPWQFNRHCFFKLLARDYRANGDEATARTWVDMMTSWFDQAPCPPDGADVRKTTICWRTIDAGIRACQWIRDLPPFVRSPSVSDEFLTRYFASVWEHGNFLRSRTTVNNWLIHELEGLVEIAALYPFLKGADEWRDFALRRLAEELSVQVYPDGMQIELTTGYHTICAEKYRNIQAFLKRHGVSVPEEFDQGIERMYDALVTMLTPDWGVPPLNDSGWIGHASFVRMMSAVAPLYPEREDFAYYASDGKVGKPNPTLSCAMPYTGAVIFRSSRDENGVWAYMDCSPYGCGHQHEDKLNFLLHAYGRRMITEGGCFAYDNSPMRAYVLSTRAHNTAILDGEGQYQLKEWLGTWNKKELTRKADTGFVASPDRDVAESSYSGLYGFRDPKRFTHRRRTTFVKRLNGKAVKPFFVIDDRFEALDDKVHTYQLPWHLETCDLTLADHGFSADFNGVKLHVCWSDKNAKVKDMKGTDGPGHYDWQGWLPSGPGRSYRPIPTPVVSGSFAGSHRVVTVICPDDTGRQGAFDVEVDGPSSSTIRLVRSDGKTVTVECGPCGSKASSRSEAVSALMRRVADSYLARNPYEKEQYALWWNWATLWWGVTALGLSDSESRYVDYMKGLGEHFNWSYYKTEPIGYYADSQCIGQAYLELALAGKIGKDKLAEFKGVLDKVGFEAPATGDSLDWSVTGLRRWKWCDALFMAPTAFARMSSLTGDVKYRTFADSEYRATADFLFNRQYSLFHRDSRYFKKTCANGKPEFWSRGNGWVFASLALMLRDMPQDWPTHGYYLDLYRKMAKSVKDAQTADGTWHANLLAPEENGGAPEMSGTCLYLFGYLRGLNSGVFDEVDYGPVVDRAWQAVSAAVTPAGHLGQMQKMGSAPGAASKDEEAPYGVGAFLAAGVEMKGRLVQREGGWAKRIAVGDPTGQYVAQKEVRVDWTPASGTAKVFDLRNGAFVPCSVRDGAVVFTTYLPAGATREFLIGDGN